MSATLISLRTSVCASSARRGVAYYAALVLAAFAIVAAFVEGWWPLAVLAALVAALLLWLAYAWAVPGTVDGHRARVARLLRGVRDTSRWVYSPTVQAARLSHQLRRLQPPEAWRDQHEQILELVGEAGASRDAEMALRERVRRNTARRRGFDAALERFRRRQATPQEEQYVASLSALIEQSRSYGRGRLPALGAELDRGLARLRRMRAPSAMAADHAALVQAFGDYVTASKALYAMWDAEPPGEDEHVLAGFEQAYAQLNAALVPYRPANATRRP